MLLTVVNSACAVHITRAAEGDIEAAIDYLLSQFADEAAADLWQAFEEAFASLAKLPLRGHFPPEMQEHPDKKIREIHAGPYRLIYRVLEKDVYVLCVADSRRDIQKTLLERALNFGILGVGCR
ncbi:type II toxin-antitoxin system RelE/ParE family toxin [Desulfovibrio sp. OttesenSCG-928-M14]|nr:type II toxin-antitoxin system RelE/ParE family toxin [Desulfovibrio sp. OttesenSCG-928-M14]